MMYSLPPNKAKKNRNPKHLTRREFSDRERGNKGSINDFFEKIFIINLKRRPERRKAVKALMDEHGIDFEFVDAVDGQKKFSGSEHVGVDMKLWGDYVEKNFIKLGDWNPSAGQIGCWLSHVEIWKR